MDDGGVSTFFSPERLTTITIVILILAGIIVAKFKGLWYTKEEYQKETARADKAERRAERGDEERDDLRADHARLIATNEVLTESMERLSETLNVAMQQRNRTRS